MLRDYQKRAIDDLYTWLYKNKGNPCLKLPTGSGKSHVIAGFCKDAVMKWPSTKILMLTHVKELIEQNANKIIEHWPNAPMGIYSASVGQRNLDEPITFAGIQSLRGKSKSLGHIDLIIIDECHTVSHKNEGAYRVLINELKEINPNIRVIGLTATPYRLGHGYIFDGDAIFDDLIDPVSIEELIHKGYLSKLKSKITKKALNVEGVKKRGGEYIEKELQAAVNTSDNNESVINEVINLAGDRKAWLFFCTGIDHAMKIKDLLIEKGIVAECITGKTSKAERESIIKRYKNGEIQALTNANVLTTGFDYPDIDLIAMLRPTLSPGLYVQMVGRGMRLKSHTDHCLVLDFAGGVQQHGPITNVIPPTKKGVNTSGEPPVKVCDECGELVHPTVKICPECNTVFPIVNKKPYKLHEDDIMGKEPIEMSVSSWRWSSHISKTTKIKMIKIRYYSDNLIKKPVEEYLCINHNGYSGQNALLILDKIKEECRVKDVPLLTEDIVSLFNSCSPPNIISYTQIGRLYQIKRKVWI